ncbi:MAG: dioxygenase family protein [Rhodospirillales bacterium]
MPSCSTRRDMLAFAASSLAVLGAPGLIRPAWGAGLTSTPQMTEGPFYPVAIPADADSDLTHVVGQGAGARGVVVLVGGRVLDQDGRPIQGAAVEIWQCDSGGRYLHPGDRGARDQGFQGFGRATTGGDGAYRFRTIRPVPYSGRTPHIHFAVLAPARKRLVTQMFVAGEAGNERDFLYRSLDPQARRAVTVELAPAAGQAAGTLSGAFDIVLPAA